ncbi:hypothetical protein KY290_000888 [Solanum tuberosum]|uniref:Uncharacterized protein n=1 Tax=Solanum tuberosum TaxID=4113 RepID=A0ABQ7WMT9_SOLTU|nr:hypothetical protein KY290_000888 [Solanum tuberosum]
MKTTTQKKSSDALDPDGSHGHKFMQIVGALALLLSSLLIVMMLWRFSSDEGDSSENSAVEKHNHV